MFSRSHLVVTLIAVAIFGLCSFFTTHLTFFNPVKRALDNFYLSDIYYQMLDDVGHRRSNDLITIVDATQLYDRSRIGQMFEEVAECKPAVIGVDCIYQGFRGDTIGTNRLVEGAFSMDSPVFAVKLKGYDSESGCYSNIVRSVMFIPELEGEIVGGFTNVSYDSSRSTVRKFVTDMVVNGDTVHSLSYMIASAFNADVESMRSIEPQFIDYTPTDFNVVPYDSIRQYKKLLKDHIVIIGAMDDDADKHFSPYGLRPGTEIQAYMTQTLIEQNTKRNVSGWIVFFVSVIIVWLTDVMQTEINRCCTRSKNIVVATLFQTALFKNVINLIWIGLLIYFNFILFTFFDIHFNPSMMLVCIAVLVEARLFYDSGVKALRLRRNRLASQQSASVEEEEKAEEGENIEETAESTDSIDTENNTINP